MKNEYINNLKNLIENTYPNIASMVILKNGVCASEFFINGFHSNTAIHIESVTKSIFSLLIGISIDKGYVNSLEDNVLDYFPDYRLKRGEKTLQNIKLRHLLTMTAPYKYKSEPYTKVFSSEDWVVSSLNLLGGKGKIGDFNYTTVGLQVLSGILSNATNQSVSEFANENLFLPLKIKAVKNIEVKTKEDYFYFLKEYKNSGWVADPGGANTPGWGLALTAEDMAKIGQLLLAHGCYNDQYIISPAWIDESVSAHSFWQNKAYGYLWWVVDEKMKTYAAIGDSGNIIYISHQKQLVVSILSTFRPRARDRIEFITKHIEPVFK